MQWFSDNKKWLFSGIGVAVVVAILNLAIGGSESSHTEGTQSPICNGEECSIEYNNGISPQEHLDSLEEERDRILKEAEVTHQKEKEIFRYKLKEIANHSNKILVDIDSLVKLLMTADNEGLEFISSAGASPEMVINALSQKIEGAGTVALHFFKATKQNVDALGWFKKQLQSHLDPNLLLPGTYYEKESILTAAIKSGNIAAMRILLEAGAAPHPIQKLDGTSHYWPQFLNPLRAFARNYKNISINDRQSMTKLLLEFGAVLPSKVLRSVSGGLIGGQLNDRKIINDNYYEPLGIMGSEYQSSPDLCEVTRPQLCMRASQAYGFNWCDFVDELPKGVVGTGDGAYHISPIFLEHLIAIDKYAAYFIDLGAGSNFGLGASHLRIIRVSKDRSQIHVMTHDDSYDCKKGKYCWKEELLRRQGKGFKYKYNSWGGDFVPVDVCEAAKNHDKNMKENIKDIRWKELVLADSEPFDNLSIGLLGMQNYSRDDYALSKAAYDLFSSERRRRSEFIDLNNRFPDEKQVIVRWDEEKLNKETRDIYVKYITSRDVSWDELYPDLPGEQRMLEFLDIKLIKGRLYEFAKKDIVPLIEDLFQEIRKIDPPKKVYLTRSIRGLRYDLERNAFISDSGKRGSIGLRPEIINPSFGKQDQPLKRASYPPVLPESARGHILLRADANNISLTASDSILRRRKTQREFSWKPHLSSYGLAIDALALNRSVIFDEFKVPPELAERLLSKMPGPMTTKKEWYLVAILSDLNVSTATYELFDKGIIKETNSSVLFANVDEVLLVTPNDEIAYRVLGNQLPSALKNHKQ
jgi:hypothetical protein